MQEMLDFAMGPLVRFSLVVLILGLGRVVFITVWGMAKALANTQDKKVPYKKLIIETLGWMIPIKHIFQTRVMFNITSILFHIGLIIVPIFLLDHILLWKRGLGISWPSINPLAADILTLTTLTCAILLLGWRIFHKLSRDLSRGIDYMLLLIIIMLFASGFIASKPYSPINYNTAMLIHALCGNAILIMIPFTKLAHCFLYPLLRIASNIAWRFPARAGEKINMILYGEEIRKI